MKHVRPVSHVRIEKAVDVGFASNFILLVVDILNAVITKKSNLK
jgi:hypothetical protein